MFFFHPSGTLTGSRTLQVHKRTQIIALDPKSGEGEGVRIQKARSDLQSLHESYVHERLKTLRGLRKAWHGRREPPLGQD